MLYQMRSLYRHPAFSAFAVCSLAAGLILVAALASLADAILYAPLPVARPAEIVRIFTATADQPLGLLSYPDFENLLRASTLRGAVAETQVLIAAGDPPRIRMGLAVSRDYFDVLGVRASAGRTFRPDDGGAPVVVLAWSFRREHPGNTIRLGQTLFTVIGAAPKNFGLDRFLHEDFYVSTGAYAAGLLPSAGHPLEDRGRRLFHVFARLNGAIEPARAGLSSLAARLETQFPDTNRGRRFVVVTESEARLRSDRSLPALAQILSATALLIAAIAAANFAGLMLARSEARARDQAIRVALGATPLRLIFENLRETALLAVLAAAIGIPFGSALAKAVARAAVLPTDFHLSIEPVLSLRIVVFIAAMATLAGTFVSCPPFAAESSAQSRERRRAGRDTWWRPALIVFEIALASLLCSTGAMLVGKISAIRRADPGYRTKNIFVAALDPAQNGYSEAHVKIYYDQLLDRLRALPGVRQAALAQSVPLGYTAAQREVAFAGEGEKHGIWMNIVTPEYFRLMRILPVEGRVFQDRDRDAAVVNREFARRCGPGCRFRIGRRQVEVVGVVPTAKYFSLGEPPRPYFYLPFAQDYASRRIVHVDGGSPAEILGEIRRLDPAVAVSETRMLDDYLSQGATFPARIARDAALIVGISALALALAGLFGIVSHDAARRRREIAIRIALGARRCAVTRLVLKQGLLVSAFGTLAGLIPALAAAPALARATGPGAFEIRLAPVAAAAVFAVASIAALVPGWRASSLDPATVLHEH